MEESVDELALLLDAEQASALAQPESSSEPEESIESYMARLLARAGGKAQPAVSVTRKEEVQQKPAKAVVAPDTAPAVTAAPAEPKRQAVRPPENKDALSNMRALANMSTHAALGTHSNRIMADSAAKLMALSAGLSVASCVLAVLSIKFGSVAYGVSVAAFAVAICLGVRFSKLASRITRSRNPQDDQNRESPVADQAGDGECAAIVS